MGNAATLCIVATMLVAAFGLLVTSMPRKTSDPSLPSDRPTKLASPARLPDYRLKWLGTGAQAVSVSGDWNSWAVPGVPMQRDEGNNWATDVFLPVDCPRKNLILTGVCCYRYKFYIDTGAKQRWLHDPRQPMDKDPDGWVNNFMCKYDSTSRHRPLPMIPPNVVSQAHGKWKTTGKPKDTNAASAAMQLPPSTKASVTSGATMGSITGASSPPPPESIEVCFVLPATYLNGTALAATSTRGIGACCEVCRRKPGCMAYNWRPEPLPRNCVMFGQNFGSPRGTALSSAGLVQVPYSSPPPPPELASSPAPALSHRRHQRKRHNHRVPGARVGIFT